MYSLRWAEDENAVIILMKFKLSDHNADKHHIKLDNDFFLLLFSLFEFQFYANLFI